MMRTVCVCGAGSGSLVVAVTTARAANNQMVKGSIESINADTSVLVVSQKVKDEVVDRELEILDSTEVEVTTDQGTDSAIGKAGSQTAGGQGRRLGEGEVR